MEVVTMPDDLEHVTATDIIRTRLALYKIPYVGHDGDEYRLTRWEEGPSDVYTFREKISDGSTKIIHEGYNPNLWLVLNSI